MSMPFLSTRPTYSFLNFVRNYCKENGVFPKQIFSGIQPTGNIHLGNYLGALRSWVTLQSTENNVIFSIADLHSITLPQNPKVLHQNTLEIAATLLASGIDSEKSTLFLQSSVPQHAELCWILGTMATMSRLSHLPQYKEKSAGVKEIPFGLFAYPVLQAADILLYKASHVPVGKDQLQQIQMAQQLAATFNHRHGLTFPKPEYLIDDQAASIKNLRNPAKKMSKSEADPKSRINLTDSPDEILEKCKKAVTDFTSEVTYDPANRPGVANLILIHSLITNKSPEEICKENQNINTGQYKLVLADALIEFLNPIRERMNNYLASPEFLCQVLHSGSVRAVDKAEATLQEVKSKVGFLDVKNENNFSLEAKSFSNSLKR